MRINELHLQDFGMFHDYTISFDPQAQLIYGDNEQGKTTLMGFIMLMFYGDQGRNSKFNLTLRKKYMPWNGNKSAGTMTFISGGITYRVEKEFGGTQRTDRVRVLNLTEGKEIKLPDQEEVGQYFFHLDRDGFEKTGFISTVGAFDGDDKDQVTAQLVQNLAQTGDEDVSSEVVVKRLDDARFSLVSRNQKNGRLVDAQAQLTNLQDEQQATKELLTEQNQHVDDLKTLAKKRQERDQLKEQLSKDDELRKMAQRQQLLNALVESKHKHQTLSQFPMAPNDISDFIQKAGNKVSAARDARAELKGLSADTESQQHIPINQEELAAVKQQDKMLKTLSNLQQSYSTMTKPLGEKYNQTQQHITDLSDQLAAQKQTIEATKADTDQYNQWHDKLEQAYQSEQALKVQLGVLAEQTKAAEEARSDRQRSMQNATIAGVVIAVIGLILSVVIGVAGIGISAVGAAVLIYGIVNRSRIAPVGDNGQSALTDQLTQTQNVEKEATEKMASLQPKVDAHGQAENTVQSVTVELRSAQQNFAEADQAWQKAMANWQNQLSTMAYQLPELTVTRLGEMDDALKQAIKQVRDILTAKLAEKKVADVAAYEVAFQTQNAQEKRLAAHDRAKHAAQDAENTVVALFKDFVPKPTTIAESEQSLSRLKTAWEDDQEAQRKVAHMRAANGIQDDQAQLEDSLAQQETGTPLTDNERRDINDQLTSLGQHLDEQWYTIQNQIKTPDHSIDELQGMIAEQTEYVKRLQMRHTALTTAVRMLNETLDERRQNFAPKLQDMVGKYLSVLTSQRYDTVMIPKTYALEVQSDGAYREYRYLSSGTVDQAYLALRVAITNLLKPQDQEEAMPMILDDVLREYDETRAQNALRFLGQQDDQHQLIFFTCHKHLCPLAEKVGFKVKTVVRGR